MPNRPSRTAIEKKAIETYGEDAQIDICIEEMSELIKALLKYRRDPSPENIKNILEEAADTLLGIDYIHLIFGPTDIVEDAKLTRLAKNLGMLEDKPEVEIFKKVEKITTDSGREALRKDEVKIYTYDGDNKVRVSLGPGVAEKLSEYVEFGFITPVDAPQKLYFLSGDKESGYKCSRNDAAYASRVGRIQITRREAPEKFRPFLGIYKLKEDSMGLYITGAVGKSW